MLSNIEIKLGLDTAFHSKTSKLSEKPDTIANCIVLKDAKLYIIYSCQRELFVVIPEVEENL